MQHRQANESFLLPSVRCRGEAFRMGMGSPPIPLSLSRETVGGCALPRLFGVIIGPAPVMREAAADLPRQWKRMEVGGSFPETREKGPDVPPPYGCATAASLDAGLPRPFVGPGAGASPADFLPAPPKPAGSGWLWHRSMDRFGSANRVGISSPSVAPKPRAALLPHPALRKGAPEGGTPGPPAWQGLPPGSKCGRQPPGKPGSGASALLAREKGAGCSSPLPACKGC